MKRPILIAAAALLCFTACADADSSSSSLTSSEALDSALEEYAKEENPYAFLPETVRLDDTYHIHEVEPDAEGMINLPKLGFRYAAPAGMETFVFERDPWDKDDPYNAENNAEKYNYFNYTCEAAAFLTTSFFPEITDHIRLCYWTEVEINIMTLEDYNDRVPPGMQLNESEYCETLRQNFERVIPFITSTEDLYCYDFSDPDNLYDPSSADSSEDEIMQLDPNEDYVLYVGSYINASTKHFAPGSERTNVATEYVELSNECYGYKITYDQTRYGFPMEKHVYWLYTRGQRRLHRIEFSYDKRRSEPLITDEQGFLESLELLDPEIAKEGTVQENYYGGVKRNW
ncbi:MAG: hypothetical protein IKP95_13155 [Ruminococcus sp.]|nr:hypothetical protein [Ruminococcus sp.]